MSKYWDAFENNDNFYNKKKVRQILEEKGNAVRFVEYYKPGYEYDKYLCDRTRSPKKMSSCGSLLGWCNGVCGRTKRLSSAERLCMKKYQNKKRRQFLKRVEEY